MIVVEYIPNGNLKEFLLRSRGRDKDTYSNLAPYSTSLTSKDLISFAYQIARGMSYLERIKVNLVLHHFQGCLLFFNIISLYRTYLKIAANLVYIYIYIQIAPYDFVLE